MHLYIHKISCAKRKKSLINNSLSRSTCLYLKSLGPDSPLGRVTGVQTCTWEQKIFCMRNQKVLRGSLRGNVPTSTLRFTSGIKQTVPDTRHKILYCVTHLTLRLVSEWSILRGRKLLVGEMIACELVLPKYMYVRLMKGWTLTLIERKKNLCFYFVLVFIFLRQSLL